MIARGNHIQTLNETYAIRKSDGGMVFDCDAPYKASSGLDNSADVRKAMRPDTKVDIDERMAEWQKSK